NNSQQGLLIGATQQPIGRWTLSIDSFDGFGTGRAGKFGLLTFPELWMHSDDVRFQGESPLCCPDLKNIFVRLPRSAGFSRNRFLSGCAHSFDFVVDSHWPCFAESRIPKPVADARLNPKHGSPLPAGYDVCVRNVEIRVADAYKVAALQSRVESEAADCATKTGFSKRYGVRRIMTVGSTSRQTYSNVLTDFDLVIETKVVQADISRADLRRLVDELIYRILRTPEFVVYCDLIQETAPLSRRPVVQESFFGVRGKQSFVSRHEMEFEGKRHNVFDITFGNLPQLIGYEIWIQRYLRELSSIDRKQIQHEVRLAKRLLSKMGDLYGLGTSGFRGNIVEQFIIQGRDY